MCRLKKKRHGRTGKRPKRVPGMAAGPPATWSTTVEGSPFLFSLAQGKKASLLSSILLLSNSTFHPVFFSLLSLGRAVDTNHSGWRKEGEAKRGGERERENEMVSANHKSLHAKSQTTSFCRWFDGKNLARPCAVADAFLSSGDGCCCAAEKRGIGVHQINKTFDCLPHFVLFFPFEYSTIIVSREVSSTTRNKKTFPLDRNPS